MATSGAGKGKGDMDTVVLRHSSGATAEIYLWGATVVTYKSSEGKDRIFCSPGAIFDGKKAIRGGIPVVFPQFGQPDKAMPQHGFARSSLWSLGEVKDNAEESSAVFTLTESPETLEKWNHAFRLEYRVSLTAVSLKLSLRVANSGAAPFDYHCLLHTYLSVPDIKDATVCGLTGRTYIDKVKGEEKVVEANPEVALPSFTDRIYLAEAAIVKTLTVKSAGTPVFALENEAREGPDLAPCDVVTWNPYEEASPGDLPVPAFKEFICVEPGLVGAMHQLACGGVAELLQTIIPV